MRWQSALSAKAHQCCAHAMHTGSMCVQVAYATISSTVLVMLHLFYLFHFCLGFCDLFPRMHAFRDWERVLEGSGARIPEHHCREDHVSGR